ncbi:MAG: RNA polymerase sigma factor, partial [Acidimicrobiales bacterium]
MDDAALVQRAADGDLVAFGEMYDRYAGRLHDFFWWVLRDAELADEALGEAFLEAGARIGDLRDPGRLRPWLFAIAGHEALRYRAPRRGETAPVAPPTGDAAWDGLVERLGDVIDGLSPRDRVLLHLRYRQNLDGLDLADAIGAKPDDAAMLVDSLSQRVERDIGATAVAYFGPDRCPGLADIVGHGDGDAGGEIDAKTREKVANHADMCQTCAELRRRRIGPPALIALSPPPPLPESERSRVMEDVELAEHGGRDWPARRLGFPPPLVGGHAKRWRFIVAAVLILLLGIGAFVLNRNGDPTDVASVGPTTVPGSTTSLRPTSTSTSSTTTSTSVPEGEAAGTGGTGTGTGGATGGTTPRA